MLKISIQDGKIKVPRFLVTRLETRCQRASYDESPSIVFRLVTFLSIVFDAEALSLSFFC